LRFVKRMAHFYRETQEKPKLFKVGEALRDFCYVYIMISTSCVFLDASNSVANGANYLSVMSTV